ncbi:MAG: RidA family protein [Pseudomonadota bacterium]
MTDSSSTIRLEHGAPGEEGMPFSSFVRAGDFIYLSGLVALGDDQEIVSGGVGAETTKILDVADGILRKAGSSLKDVVKVSICLANPSDFDEFNAVYAKYFTSKPPARATICASLTIDAKVEIELTAYQPNGLQGS